MEVKSLLVKIGTDVTAMEAGFKKADGYVQKHAAQFKKAGRAVAVAGAAITGMVGMIVKKASDAQETYAKFGTVFKDVSKEAETAAKDLASGYGLSTLAAKDMMGATGDLLTGLGMQSDVALDLSDKTQKLAVDLASFTNFSGGATGASEALTKAMLGERESIKSLGIVITEEMVKEKLLAEGKGDLTGLSKKQAQAEATLAIAYEQSKNAIGDYERTSGSLANVTRTLKSGFEDIFVAIGMQLIPVVTDIAVKIKAAAGKVKDWIKENPKLTGTIAKIALGIGALMVILGPLLMILPALTAGFTILWGAITGPVGLVIAAVAAVAAAAYLIYKNWEPIKEFFIKLWKSVSGFFVNAFTSIKKKVLDWAIAITGILAKIPIVKKLAGPWKESLEQMRASMDETVANVEAGATAISDSSAAIGQAWVTAIAGTTLFKDASAAAAEQTGVLAKGLAFLKVGLKAVTTSFDKTGGSSEENAEKIAAANKKITDLTKTMVDEIKKATLDDYEYSKWALEQKRDARLDAIEEEKASVSEKNAAIAMANESYRAEQEALDKAHKEKEVDRQKELSTKWKEIWAAYWKSVTEKHEAYLSEKEALLDSINAITKSERDNAMLAIDAAYDKRKKRIEDTIEDEEQKAELLKLLDEETWVKRNDLAEEYKKKELQRIQDLVDAQKAALEQTLSNISMILNQIGSLFQMSYQNQMIRIDNEEKRWLEALDIKYAASLEAAADLLALEKETTQRKMDELDAWYEAEKQEILDNITDEEDRKKALEKLDNKLARKRERLLERRAEKEQETADALEAIEEAKNEALRIASEELETKRSEARRTAAKQEKAVALLSAIVNTAAAIVKALPNIPLAIAVGILGAIQIAIIKARPIPLKEGGIVMKRTVAEIGEAGPEAVIPLNKLQPALAGGLGGGFKQFNYFYGDINNAGDVDEISRRLAEKTRRAIERGRI